MNLKGMSIERLTVLRDNVEVALKSKVTETRRSLEAELAKLSRFGGPVGAGLSLGRRGPVAPKYRNPQNPSETWAGRGLKPRWLAAALKSGKKLESFAIAAPAARAAATKSAMKKGRRAGKR
jgi:DNA-binding protein H-NS